MTQADRIATGLRNGALTVAEIADAIGFSANLARAVLCRYPGRFVNIQEGQRIGRWGLLAPANWDKET